MSELETTVTIKYGKEFDKTWAVFKGGNEQVRSRIVDYFGLTDDGSQTLHEVVVEATKVAQGAIRPAPVKTTVKRDKAPETTDEAVENVKDQLGGEVIKDSADPWAGVEQGGTKSEPEPEQPAGEDYSDLIEQLRNAADVKVLKKLYVTNKDAFTDEEVVAAYKARGKALSST